MELTTFLAVWGSVLATTLAAWEFYKWKRSGPRLVVNLSGGMVSTDRSDNQKYFSVRVSNVGSAATTLNAITYRYFAKKPRWLWRQKPDERGLLDREHMFTAGLPNRLDVGSEWTHMFVLNPTVERMAIDGYFFVEVEDSSTHSANKFVRKRLILSSSPVTSEAVPRVGITI